MPSWCIFSLVCHYSIKSIMSNPFEDIKQLLATPDEASRGAVLRQLHEIIVSAETPKDTATRMLVFT